MNSKMSDETLPNLFISLDIIQSEKVTIAPQFNHRHQKRLSEWYSQKKKEKGGGGGEGVARCQRRLAGTAREQRKRNNLLSIQLLYVLKEKNSLTSLSHLDLTLYPKRCALVQKKLRCSINYGKDSECFDLVFYPCPCM